MNTKTQIIALLLVATLLLAGCSSANLNQTTNTTNQTNNTDSTFEDSQTTTYVTTNLETCKVIKYVCAQGKEPFSDADGCGCRPITGDTTQTEPTKTYCTPEQKSAQICTLEYHQVCGWFGENIKCLKFPCAIEAASPCTACATDNVDYYTEGACPTDITQTMPTKTSSELMEIVDPQKACTMDYTPVCALFDDGKSLTMGNACAASNIKGIVSTKPDECAEQSPAEPKRVVFECAQNYIDMQSENGAACTKEYMPVCATDVADAQRTFGNKCEACTTPGVFEYTDGACNDAKGAVI